MSFVCKLGPLVVSSGGSLQVMPWGHSGSRRRQPLCPASNKVAMRPQLPCPAPPSSQQSSKVWSYDKILFGCGNQYSHQYAWISKPKTLHNVSKSQRNINSTVLFIWCPKTSKSKQYIAHEYILIIDKKQGNYNAKFRRPKKRL